jgi:hypothetical protein
VAYGDFDEVCQQVAKWAQRTYADDQLEIEDQVNMAFQMINQSDHPWRFNFFEHQYTLAAGTSEYTYAAIATDASLTDGIQSITTIVNSTDGTQPLRWLSPESFEEFAYSSYDDDSRSWPVAWTTYGSGTGASIRIWPAPQNNYVFTIIGHKAQAEQTGTGGNIWIPEAYRYTVAGAWAAASLLMADSTAFQTGSQYDRLMSMYRENLEEMRNTYADAHTYMLNLQSETAFSHLPGTYTKRD